jgi:ArsR family transcriptional regulator
MATRMIDVRVLEAASKVIKTLGHPLRLRIVELLEGGEKTVGELVDALGVEQAIASQQLVKLRAKGVVAARRNGVNVFYRINNRRVLKILACVRGCSVKDFT